MSQPEMKVDSNGTKSWTLNGKYHREDGPAVEWTDGSKEWWINGEYHREDGPAIEYPNGTKQWYLNGKQVSWKEVFHNAKGDLEKECRILIYAFTDGLANVAT
jgi:hypothetical protein